MWGSDQKGYTSKSSNKYQRGGTGFIAFNMAPVIENIFVQVGLIVIVLFLVSLVCKSLQRGG
jgi:hypothetical protein